MNARDYLNRILRDVPKHQGYPHQDYKDWLMCKICAPKYRKYLDEKN